MTIEIHSGFYIFQVYEGESKTYTYQDKYYGFQVTKESIKDEFIRFLHNGKHIRKKVVAAFINQLQQLYACIKEQKDSRFYSSSLLLIYEGFEEIPTAEVNGIGTESETTSVDTTENGRTSAEGVKQSNGICKSDIDEKLNSFDIKQGTQSEKETQALNGIHTDVISGLSSEKVGVKMIDFARSFHGSGQGRTEMDPYKDSLDGGPDEGYLLGLNSLINLLRDILMQS